LDETSRKILAASGSGTSIFDPVLCELAYRWFAPPGGRVLDPFAGGSVRGIVAAYLGYAYTGFELRPEQVAANLEQAARIVPGGACEWVTGDSAANIPAWGGAADFVFSCPPYGDLEVYSDDPADLSAMPLGGFREAYRAIIAAAVDKLRPDRFACFVVGNYRNKKGFYVDLVGETVRAFEDAGAGYYNEAVLVTAVGSLPIRAGKQFTAARKLGKTHQNVLVFCKGDPRRATNRIEGRE
jgi:predicted RNA methylase